MLAWASMGPRQKVSGEVTRQGGPGETGNKGIMRLALHYDLDFAELLRLKRVQAFLVGGRLARGLRRAS
jgi:hypothetical protein